MALDEPKEQDTVVVQDGISFVLDLQMVKYVPAVTIGYRNSWLGSGLFVEAGSSFDC